MAAYHALDASVCAAINAQSVSFGYDGHGRRAFRQLSSGRFTQLDPWPRSLVEGNRYAYAGCNPANFVDPRSLAHSNSGRCVH